MKRGMMPHNEHRRGLCQLICREATLGKEVEGFPPGSSEAARAGTVISRQIWNLFFISCRWVGRGAPMAARAAVLHPWENPLFHRGGSRSGGTFLGAPKEDCSPC